jgi:queuosine precursor transporter
MNKQGIITAFLAMMIIVASSNYLVQFPINDWLTFGAFPYPISFLVTELTNRFYGPKIARKVVYVGFILGVILSACFAPLKIASASAGAFLISQLLDIYVFNEFRQAKWWYAPFFASVSASLIDTLIFWNVAFWGEPVPLMTWAAGDFGVKFIIDLLMLTPFRFAINKLSITNSKA